MPQSGSSTQRLMRFGVFELDLEAGELRKNGRKLKIQGQPLQILQCLLERPGHLVSREDLQQKIWPSDTFVDFEHSINSAIKRLRQALDDSADTPRFIETLPRRGYRFIYPVNETAPELPGGQMVPPPTARDPGSATLDTSARVRQSRRALLWASLGAIAVLSLLVVLSLRPSTTAGPVRSVAVLPFADGTGSPGQEWLADGITDGLTTELDQFEQLFVPSLTSTMTYKRQQKRTPTIAHDLEVQACIEGSVQRPGGGLLVSVRLVDGTTDRQLWGKKYARDSYARDPTVLQPLLHEIVRDLVREMKVPLTADQQMQMAQARTLNPEALQAYVIARRYLNGGTEADRTKAEQLFSRAIEIDPSYAQPYAEIALVFSHGGYFLIGGSPPDRTKARQMAQKALELDSGLAEAHAALGWVEMSEWDWLSAEQHFRRAIDLNPNLRVAHVWYAEFLTAMGRPAEEAVKQADWAIRLDPRSVPSVTHAAQVYMHVGRVDKAIETYRQVLGTTDYWFAHHALGEAYTLKGLHREAIPEFEKAIALRGGTMANAKGLLARAYVGAGEPEKARQVVAELESLAKTKDGSPYALVMAYVALGEYERALDWLDKGYARHGVVVTMLNQHVFDPLRAHPRFQDLVRRVGLAPAH